MSAWNFDPPTTKAIQIASAVVSRRWRASGADKDEIASEAALAALDGRMGKPPADLIDDKQKLVWMTGRLISRLNRWCENWMTDPVHSSNRQCSYDERGTVGSGCADQSSSFTQPDPKQNLTELIDLEDFLDVRGGEATDVIRLLAQGYTYSEIAELTGESATTLASRIQRARRKGLAAP